jgi:hypothetical protein
MGRFVIEDAPTPAGTPEVRGRFVIEDAPEASTQREKYLANPLVRFAKGMKDGLDAGAQLAVRGANQLVRRGMPENVEVDPISESVSRWLQDERRTVDSDIANSEKEYALAQKKAGTGFDAMRLAGNVASPANAIPAKFVPIPLLTTGNAAKTGVIAGGTGAALQPVTSEKDQANFGAAKGEQVALGAGTGAALTPILAKVIPAAVGWFGNLRGRQVSEESIEAAVRKAFKDAKIEGETLEPALMEAVKGEVRTALKTGQMPDIAALARRADFEKLGVKPTTGQLTRDPLQWTKESNLRAAPGGEELMTAMQGQERALRGKLGEVAGKADEPFQAGERMKSVLQSIDRESEGKADVLYRGFRDLFPKDAAVSDPARFSNALIGKLEDDMVLGSLGSDWQGRLNKITNGEFPLNASTLHQMYVAANRQLRSARGSEEHALGMVKRAIDDEMLHLADSVAAKAPPPGAVVPAGVITPEASQSASLQAMQSLKLGQRQVAMRYGLQEELPALKAAVRGEISGEDFVKRFITGEDTAKVKRLGEVLRKASPESWNEARGQIGAVLQKAAYGGDAAADKGFRPEMFQKALDGMGRDKLLAFYSPAEVEALETIARVGAYMNSAPAKAAPNTSNTAAAVMQLLSKLPLGNKVIALGSAATRVIENDAALRKALKGAVPMKRSAELEAEAAGALVPLAVGGGIVAGGALR